MSDVTTFRGPDLPLEPLSVAAPDSQRANTPLLHLVMGGASDEAVRAPLWTYPPYTRRAVIRERRLRFGLHEETGDPEYG